MQADTATPIQSAPQASPTQPSSYGAPAQTAAQAPTVATTPQWVAPSQAQVAPAPQMPSQVAAQPYSPIPSVPQTAAPQGDNPYREAFNKVVGLLSSPVQFPFQGQQSEVNPATVQANYSSPATTQYSNLGTPTSQPSQDYYNNYSQTSTEAEITPDQLLANGVSEESINVIDHFGPDTAAILNNYSCNLEDALVQTNEQLTEGVGLLQEISEEHSAYEAILTDPDLLADYTVQFFGPEGPYPVNEGNAQPAGMRTGVDPMPRQAPAPRPEQQQFQRPEMPVPPQPQPQGNPEDFWNSFGSLADQDPSQAWRYLNMASQNPEVFRQKLLVME